MDPTQRKLELKFCLIPSLKHSTYANLIILFINHNCGKNQYEAVFENNDHPWGALNTYVNHKISQLPLPKSIKHELNEYILPIINEIRKWIVFHSDIDHSYYFWEKTVIRYLDNFVWTPRGTIDYPKTAKNLIAMDMDDVSDRTKYRIACKNYLEQEVSQYPIDISNPNCVRDKSMMYWAYHFDHEIKSVNDEIMLFNSQTENNYSSREYFLYTNHEEMFLKFIWNQMTEDERTKVIEINAEISKSASFFRFLLPKLNVSQRESLFERQLLSIIISFMKEFLWLDCLISLLDHVWDRLTKDEFYNILMVFACLRSNFLFDNNNYKSGIETFWLYAPEKFKNYVLDFGDGKAAAILVHQLSTNGFDFIPLLLSNAQSKQKKNLMFHL